MSGNVEEWCEDCHDFYAFRRYAKGDLSLPRPDGGKVLRSTGYIHKDPKLYRVTNRDSLLYGSYSYIGFRCARGAHRGPELMRFDVAEAPRF